MTDRGFKILVEQKFLPRIEGTNFKFCEQCIMGKQKRVPFIRDGPKTNMKTLDLH